MASTTKQDSAKRGYALVVAGAQIGSIAGPTFGRYASVIGMSQLSVIVGIGMLMVPVLIMLFVKRYPEVKVEKASEKKKTGPIEGLKLLLSRGYLLGILGISTLYEIIGTIIDYQMKLLADSTYRSPERVTEFLSLFAQSANLLAFVFALIGTSFFIRKFGLTFCLVMFPATIGCVVLYVWFSPSLWVLFGAMVAVKGFSYALNNPCKEILYIPTSKDVKFKAKGWIDMFGGRSSKAMGSGINAAFVKMADLMFYGSLISLGVVGFWIMVALYVGRTNEVLTKDGKIIQ